MATTAGSRCFVDTNVLVYARHLTSPFRAAAVAALDQQTLAGSELWISRQTLREYASAVSKPGAVSPPPTPVSLEADLRGFLRRFMLAEDGPVVTDMWLALLAASPCAGKQVHDANIVATAIAHAVPSLLTHNVADFTRFAGRITIVPMIPAVSAPVTPPGVP